MSWPWIMKTETLIKRYASFFTTGQIYRFRGHILLRDKEFLLYIYGTYSLVKEFSFSNQKGLYEFDTANLPPGMYMFNFGLGQVTVCKKLLVSDH